MAAKKSRTGKKKRPQYGPQGSKVNELPPLTEEEIRSYKNARRANYGSLGLLVVAMVLLLFAPNAFDGNIYSTILVLIAYVLTIIAGGLILYTKNFVVPERVKMTKITAWVMIVIGALGIIFTMLSLNAA